VATTRTLWIVAVLITLVLSVWQRVSGPTYPIYGHAALAGHAFGYKLERTHAGAGDHRVVLRPGVPGAIGLLTWREHQPPSAWTQQPMSPEGDALVGALPHHAAGQKVDYRVTLTSGASTVTLPSAPQATLRFRSDVPAWVLIPHIVCMLGALLLAVRVALEAFRPQPNLKLLTLRTLSATFLGGFPLGCAVSAYAFGRPWGGFPLGNDATDDKTLLAFLGWVVASVAVFRARNPRPWVIGAAIVMFLAYLVPHSFKLPG